MARTRSSTASYIREGTSCQAEERVTIELQARRHARTSSAMAREVSAGGGRASTGNCTMQDRDQVIDLSCGGSGPPAPGALLVEQGQHAGAHGAGNETGAGRWMVRLVTAEKICAISKFAAMSTSRQSILRWRTGGGQTCPALPFPPSRSQWDRSSASWQRRPSTVTCRAGSLYTVVDGIDRPDTMPAATIARSTSVPGPGRSAELRQWTDRKGTWPCR